jgi:hypothetical protein
MFDFAPPFINDACSGGNYASRNLSFLSFIRFAFYSSFSLMAAS